MLGGCIYSIIMYLTTNDFNHDKSQPDHASQNMHVMVFMKPVLTNTSNCCRYDMICWLVIMLHIHITLNIRFDTCILLEYVIVNVILGCILILNTLIRLIAQV